MPDRGNVVPTGWGREPPGVSGRKTLPEATALDLAFSNQKVRLPFFKQRSERQPLANDNQSTFLLTLASAPLAFGRCRFSHAI
jgi:hypothetical protein